MGTDGDELSAEDRETLELVEALIGTGNLHPLIARLRTPGDGPERARAALTVLGELDPGVLVELALDTLIQEHVTSDGRPPQP